MFSLFGGITSIFRRWTSSCEAVCIVPSSWGDQLDQFSNFRASSVCECRENCFSVWVQEQRCLYVLPAQCFHHETGVNWGIQRLLWFFFGRRHQWFSWQDLTARTQRISLNICRKCLCMLLLSGKHFTRSLTELMFQEHLRTRPSPL